MQFGSLTSRTPEEDAFGLVELLIAMTVLSIALLAAVASFSSGALALNRAARASTANALASAQLEGYRALAYLDITLQASTVPLSDSIYTGDAAWPGPRVVSASCPAQSTAQNCDASQPLPGADGRSYRVDTYITSEAAPSTSRQLKKVTVVVRDPANVAGRRLARQATAFDQSSG